MESEEMLWARAREGDTAAENEIAQRYWRIYMKACNYAAEKMRLDVEDVQSMASYSYLQAIRLYDPARAGKCAFRTYIINAVNLAALQVRGKGAKAEARRKSVHLSSLENIGRMPAFRSLQSQPGGEELLVAMASLLNEQERTVVYLYVFEQLKLKQIALVYNCSKQRIGQLMVSAKEKIAQSGIMDRWAKGEDLGVKINKRKMVRFGSKIPRGGRCYQCGKPVHSRGLCLVCYEHHVHPDMKRIKRYKNRCGHESCENRAEIKGLCRCHYQQQKRVIELTPVESRDIQCCVDSCNLPVSAKGYCIKHYKSVYLKARDSQRLCKEEGCESKVYRMGWCCKHHWELYERERSLARKAKEVAA